jgi:hypothetical protein
MCRVTTRLKVQDHRPTALILSRFFLAHSPPTMAPSAFGSVSCRCSGLQLTIVPSLAHRHQPPRKLSLILLKGQQLDYYTELLRQVNIRVAPTREIASLDHLTAFALKPGDVLIHPLDSERDVMHAFALPL